MSIELSRQQVSDEFFWELFDDDDLEKWLNHLEDWMFPWCCFHPDKEKLEIGVDRYYENILARVKTPYDRACLYFGAKTSDARENLITEPIREYLDSSFFYEKFGITPFDLEHCDANWIENMIVVSNAEATYESNQGMKIRKADGTVIGG